MTSNADELAFENAIKSLEATAASLATHLEIDSAARRSYAKQIAAVSPLLPGRRLSYSATAQTFSN